MNETQGDATSRARHRSSDRRLRAVLLASLLAVIGSTLFGPSPAEAARKAVYVDQVIGDGWRYVAYQRPDGTPVVFDTWKGATREIRGAKHCYPIDIGGRRVLLGCPEGEDRPGFTYRARTASALGGRSIALPRSRHMERALQIGRYWVSYDRNCPPPSCYKGPGDQFVNWRNGRVKRFSNGGELERRNLDRPSLPRAAEPPFRVKPPYDPVKDGHLTVCHNRDVVVSDTWRSLRLWLAPHRSLTLGSGSFYEYGCDPYDPVQIGPGRVTWSKGRTVNAIDYRTLRRYKHRFRLPGASITPVRDGVVVSAKVGGRKSHGYRLRLIRLRG